MALSMARNMVQDFLSEINEIRIKEIYGCGGESPSDCTSLIVADQKIWILPIPIRFDEALTQCRSQRADLYYVRATHDLEQLMNYFNVTKVWTNVSKARQGTLQDGQGFYPEIMGKTQAISLGNFNPTDFTAKTRIIIQQDSGSFEMKIVPESELHEALCVQPLNFPYREADQTNLEALQKTYSEALQANLDSFEPIVRKTKSLLNALPKTSYNKTGDLTFDDVVHRGAEFERNILREKELGRIRKELFANLNETIQVPRITVQLLTQIYRITNMLKFITDTLENPLVAVEQIFNSAYLWSEDKKLPHELFRVEDDLILQIGEIVIKNIPSITEILNKTSFWDFSFFDLVLFLLAVFTVTAVLTATICRHFYKSKQYTSVLRENQKRNEMAAIEYTVKKVQEVRPVRETKIQKPFTGPCYSRRRHSIDIPTTMKVSIQNRNKMTTVKSKAPTIPPKMKSISNVPTYLQDSFTSLNE